MNYLAHLYLSGEPGDLMIGNFIADNVKGSKFKEYSGKIQKGILLHRHIDTFTDSHPIVRESKERLRGKYDKLSGIITDVFYDHFLAVNWNSYSPLPLKIYSREVYNFLDKNRSVLPQHSQIFLEYMVRNDILSAYAEIKGIEKVLKGLSQRLSFKPKMENAIVELEKYYYEFEADFKEFFPQLKSSF